MTMEFIDGRRLKQILRSGPLEVDVALGMARQILAGLGAAHAAGVLHRDLKSDNVMVSGQGKDTRITITDFGLSQALDQRARAVGSSGQERVGSLAYMAPEQLAGGELRPETDVFCFGVVLFEMLSGKLPFSSEGGSTMSRFEDDLEAPSSLRPGLPPSLDPIVLRCLRENPSDRFARASDVSQAIDAAVNSSRPH
jgi:serine/threonine-protein kinase